MEPRKISMNRKKQNMIELKNMSKTYAGNVKAVDNVTLKIEPGSVNDFLGLNGADKTTTIKLITGVL